MSNIKLVLQARMNSSRLPGKMLLPINGIPLVILCAKRALRGGNYPLVVATSTDSHDDSLIPVLEQNNIPYIRGPLDDVLGRFLLATEEMADDDIIVRLTGDNPAVDADFIDLILAEHERSGTSYTRSLSPFDRFPYGMSAEVISVGLLRSLNAKNPSAHEREHVTIHYTLKNQYHLFESPLPTDTSYLRMTVDTDDDYKRIVQLFSGEDSLNARWDHLLDKLTRTIKAFRTPYKRDGLKAQSLFALGTAQLGMPYGIANKSGQPNSDHAKEILQTALLHGVTWIDTASAYGVSEKVIGQSLSLSQKQGITITTKLSPSAVTAEDARESINNSISSLGIEALPYLLLHRWSQYESPAWEELLNIQRQGIIENLGVSVQTPAEGIEALNESAIKFIQLPFNICDGRWEAFIQKRAERPDVHIQARSSLLQGALTLPAEQWPADLTFSKQTRKALDDLVIKYKRKSIQDLCYAYVRAQDWIDSVVVGVESEDQMLENLHLFNESPLTGFNNTIAISNENFLNPALWAGRVK